MRVMLVGDVCGRAGREAFSRFTPGIRKEKAVDIVIVNGENSAGGKGFTRKSLDALYHGGADVVTSGNHVWDKKDVLEFIDDEPFLIRPANYPDGAPGKGYCIYPHRAKNIAVINMSGRVNAVVGTHTHVQTADERLLPSGTAYITDLGMTGPWDSVLGVRVDRVLEKFTTCRPVRFEVAEGPVVYSAVIVEVDDATNRTLSIERIMKKG